MTETQKQMAWRLACITTLILIAFCTTLNNGFVWDDHEIIVQNPLLKEPSITRMFLSEDRFSEAATGYYRPITYLSFALDRLIWGVTPLGYNLTNLLLHIMAGLLFFGAVRAMFKRDNLAFVATLIFSLHPIVSETVNFHAGGRNTLLSACFALAALLLYVDRRTIPALISFTLAIFSKEFALLLPLMFFVYDRVVNEEKKPWLSYLPFAVPIACYLALRSFAVAQGNLLKTAHLSDNLLLIPQIAVRYLCNMLYPFNLKVMYDVPDHTGLLMIGLQALVVLGAAGVVLYHRENKVLLFSATWFALFLAPVSNIFPLGVARMADRYAYFSLMGVSLLLAYLVCSSSKRLRYALVIPLCLSYLAVDLHRNGMWKDDLSLFTRMTLDAPDMLIGYQNLGIHYYNEGDLASAEKNLASAVQKKDLSEKTVHTLAALYWETGRVALAMPLMEQMIQASPRNPQPYIMLSRLHEKAGNSAQSKIYLDKAKALFPDIESVMNLRAAALCREGEALLSEHKNLLAERKFQEALMMKLDFVPALIDLGSVAAEKGELPKSIGYFKRAEELSPQNPMVHYNLSMAYDMSGRPQLAQQELLKFKELDAKYRK